MTIRPLHDRVVVKRLEAEEKTASGIILPGSAAGQTVKADGQELLVMREEDIFGIVE